ncbi:MAG: ABC transporter substrate-binding protein [Chloroflexi bacterium]|nr:ABC transporter substrate-binding protein [Chloroflexota bacterium]
MARTLSLVSAMVLLGIAIFGCSGPGVASPPAATGIAPAPKAAVAEWQQKWERTLQEAKKEGSLSFYNSWNPDTRPLLVKGFQEKYGIALEDTFFGTGVGLFSKAQAERRAGLNLADVFGVGGAQLTYNMKPAGLLRPIDNLLILPEVIDQKAWLGNEFPFYDKDKHIIGMASSLTRPVFYNTTMIKEGEITSVKDILKPQYKEKIILYDPTTGVGIFFFTHLATNVWDQQETIDFYRRVIKDQQAVVTRDPRQQVEWVARGKSAMGFGATMPELYDFMRAGAPLAIAYLKEPLPSSPERDSLAVPVVSPHPNATIVFVNWLLSKEGQTLLSRGEKNPSKRVDVPGEGFHPDAFPRPNEKVYFTNEEFAILQGKMIEVASKVVAEAQK